MRGYGWDSRLIYCEQMQTAAQKFATAQRATRYVSGFYTKNMIEGAANTGDVDREDTIVVPSGCEIDEMPIPLRWKHGGDIGTISWVRKDPSAVWIRASVEESQLGFWHRVNAGEIFRLSIGFEKITEPRLVNGVLVYDRWRLIETSLAGDGAVNQKAMCWTWTAPQFQPVPLLQGLPQGMRL